MSFLNQLRSQAKALQSQQIKTEVLDELAKLIVCEPNRFA